MSRLQLGIVYAIQIGCLYCIYYIYLNDIHVQIKYYCLINLLWTSHFTFESIKQNNSNHLQFFLAPDLCFRMLYSPFRFFLASNASTGWQANAFQYSSLSLKSLLRLKWADRTVCEQGQSYIIIDVHLKCAVIFFIIK